MPASPRSYRAPCPGCGAPVEFHSAQSSHAVCSYCQSVVVRHGETLSRAGKMAELFDDFSPLQLQASGRLEGAGAFTIVGRLQYRYADGHWTEWIAALDDGRLGVLSEDNGSYVFALPHALTRMPPRPHELRLGATTAFDGESYTVTANQQVSLVAAQGELPRLPELGQPFAWVELRTAGGKVLSLEFDRSPPAAYRGHAVALEALRLQGLRSESAREDAARAFACPHCGAPVTVHLADTLTVTCGSCNSLIDIAAGIGGELRHALQDEPVQPLIALGSMAKLQGRTWQVVGFQHRMGVLPGEDEHFGWSEYLLYHQQRGFAFLVDAQDGWSLVSPITGAPVLTSHGAVATYRGKAYRRQYIYNAETSFAQGEFYWRVHRGQKSSNADYANGAALLSMERTAREITWSGGSRLDSATVAAAVGQAHRHDLFRREEVSSLGGAARMGVGMIVSLLVLLVIVLLLLGTCSDGRAGGRGAGGSWGGYSSGGSHK